MRLLRKHKFSMKLLRNPELCIKLSQKPIHYTCSIMKKIIRPEGPAKKIILLLFCEGRCRIEFWPHWISTRGVLIQRAVLRIQRIFHVELRPQRQGVIELRPLRRIKFGPPVELWPRVLIPRWIMTLGINSTLNFDPESWFNVKLWPGIRITI